MAKIVCDLDCSKLNDSLSLPAVEAAKKEITRLIYSDRHKVGGDDVFELKIVKMPMALLHHMWSELICLPKCTVVITLDNLPSESEILFILNGTLKQKISTIKAIQILNVNSHYLDEANILIGKYCDALNKANIVTTNQRKLEPPVVTQGLFAQTTLPTVDAHVAQLAGLTIN
jgi:hypothetical protein